MEHDVFISHSSRNSEIAIEVYNSLEKQGIRCWISSIDLRKSIGCDYMIEIERAIDACKVYLVIASKQSIESKWVQYGAHKVLGDNVAGYTNTPIIVFRIDDTQLPIYLRIQQAIDAYPDYNLHIDELAKMIKGLLDEKHLEQV